MTPKAKASPKGGIRWWHVAIVIAIFAFFPILFVILLAIIVFFLVTRGIVSKGGNADYKRIEKWVTHKIGSSQYRSDDALRKRLEQLYEAELERVGKAKTQGLRDYIKSNAYRELLPKPKKK
jgi:hypothetical protein